MDRRTTEGDTASRVTTPLTDAGHTVESVSKATGISRSVLHGTSPFTVTDLARAGGFLHVHPADLIGDAA